MIHELYYVPGNASLFPHMLLREIGRPFELKLVDRDSAAHKQPDYLAMNPHGRIPVLVTDGRPLHETSAIGLFLADAHPQAGLAPPAGHPDRADHYKWMTLIAAVLQAEFRAWFYPHEYVVDPALADQAREAARARLTESFERIAEHLAGREWLLDSGVSAADFYLLMMVRWGRTLPSPIREIGPLGDHARRVLARPAVQASFEAEGLAAPFV